MFKKSYFSFLLISIVFLTFFPFAKNISAATQPKGCCVWGIQYNGTGPINFECYSLDVKHNYTQNTCTEAGIKNFRKNYFNLSEGSTSGGISWEANRYCDLSDPSGGVCIDTTKPAGHAINNNVVNPKEITVKPEKKVEASVKSTAANGLPTVALVQRGLVTNETGFLMDNCIKDGNCSVCAVLSTFAYAINWMFKIGVLGAFLMVTYFGIILLTSAGDDKKINKAKSGILGTLFGILVLFSGWTIVNTVLTSLITQEPSQSISIFNDNKQWFQYCK